MISPQQLETHCQQYAPRPRTPRKVSSEALISSLIFHQLQPGGTLAKHEARLHGIKMSDSAYSQRRQLLPVELFDQIMQTALQPLASEARQPDTSSVNASSSISSVAPANHSRVAGGMQACVQGCSSAFTLPAAIKKASCSSTGMTIVVAA